MKKDFIFFLFYVYEYPHLNEATANANEFRDIVRETAREVLGEVPDQMLTGEIGWYRQFSPISYYN